jgi:cytochrome P450
MNRETKLGPSKILNPRKSVQNGQIRPFWTDRCFLHQIETPYAFYAQVRQEEPITFSPALNAYLVSRYDDIRSILLQPDLFSSKNALGFPVKFYPQTVVELRKGLAPLATNVASDGQRHLRMREPLQTTLLRHLMKYPTRVASPVRVLGIKEV